jgi:hypothetical protein
MRSRSNSPVRHSRFPSTASMSQRPLRSLIQRPGDSMPAEPDMFQSDKTRELPAIVLSLTYSHMKKITTSRDAVVYPIGK